MIVGIAKKTLSYDWVCVLESNYTMFSSTVKSSILFTFSTIEPRIILIEKVFVRREMTNK